MSKQELSCLVIDNFYNNPHTIRERAFNYEFIEPEDLVGWRTKRGYMPRNFQQRLERLTGKKIKYLQKPQGTPDDNGTFFLSFSKGKIKENPQPHYDDPLNHYVCLVYLSENIPSDCGTSFFKHKKTQLEYYPVTKDLDRLNMSIKQVEHILDRDCTYSNRWEETDRVAHRFNRAVIFPCKRLHAASKHYGSNMENGRIYQMFTFEV